MNKTTRIRVRAGALIAVLLAVTLTAYAVQRMNGLQIGPNPSTTTIDLQADGDIIADGTITATTFAGDGSGLTGISGAAHTIEDEGTPLTARTSLNFTGAGVTAADSGGKTVVTITSGGGSGDVVGPASSVDNRLVRFDSTTGKLLQDGTIVQDDTGNLSGVGTLNTHTIPGGTGTLALTSQITGTNSGTNTGDVSLAGTPDYITISGQTITRGLVDLTTDVTGELPDGNVSNTLTASKLVGSGSTTDAVDLATPEVSGDLALSNIAQFTAGTFAGRALGGGTGDLQAMTNAQTRAAISNLTALTSTSNAVSWTASGGTKYSHTLSQNTTIGASAGTEGQIVIFMITKASTYTFGWNAQFKALDGTTASIPAIPTTAGDIGYYVFVYHEFLDDWVLLFHAEYQPV